ncbi:hypothetical protein OfM1_06140 [Lactovum odontotermitis]
MIKIKEELRSRLSEMKYGEIQAVPMIDRGSYRELDADENLDSSSADSEKYESDIFEEIVPEVKAADEDFIFVQRISPDEALKQTDFEQYFVKLTAPHHLLLINCLELGTSEIKGFLLALKENGILEKSKIFLLDLPQIEYLMLRDSLTARIDM